MYNMFRLLKAEEINLRVNQVKEINKQNEVIVKASYLLYKDARCDMNILDETVGAFNWQKSYSRDNANCIVSIYDIGKDQWISKEDTGTESNTEAEKGLASDSFKRACFNWGIGRELYTAPNIVITLNDKEYYKKTSKDGKEIIVPTLQLSVKEIEYDEQRNISYLIIVDSKGVVRFEFGHHQIKSNDINQVEIFNKLVEELNQLNISLDDVKVQQWISDKAKVKFTNNFDELGTTQQSKVNIIITALIKAKKGKQ